MRQLDTALHVFLALHVWSLFGCDNETHPVNVPFDGPDLVSVRRKVPEADTSKGEGSLSAAGSGARSGDGSLAGQPAAHGSESGNSPTGSRHRASSIAPCCAALRAASASAPPTSQSNLVAAAAACETQRMQLDQGKVTRTQALLGVRAMLVSPPPASCR